MARRVRPTLGAALVLVSWAAMTAQPAKAQEARVIAKACAGDIEQLCQGVPPGEGRIKACMKAHITQLSAPCFDTLLQAVTSEKEPPGDRRHAGAGEVLLDSSRSAVAGPFGDHPGQACPLPGAWIALAPPKV